MQRASNLFGLLALLWSARYIGAVDNSHVYFVQSLGVMYSKTINNYTIAFPEKLMYRM